MLTVEDSREAYGEPRLQSLGMWKGRVVFLVWTPRGDDAAHLISCRDADRKETDEYFERLWCRRDRRRPKGCGQRVIGEARKGRLGPGYGHPGWRRRFHAGGAAPHARTQQAACEGAGRDPARSRCRRCPQGEWARLADPRECSPEGVACLTAGQTQGAADRCGLAGGSNETAVLRALFAADSAAASPSARWRARRRSAGAGPRCFTR